MHKPHRRTFVMTLVAGCGTLAVGRVAAQTAAAPALSEADPQAVALGYKSDTTKVDNTKYPQHQVAQMCAGCSLYQGKPTDPMAPCALFAGKQVAAKGWCSAWSKRPA